jgi:hypothetical protein
MRRIVRDAALAALAAAALTWRAPCQETHKFPDHGFRITAPANWTLVPPRPGEQWILAHFLSNREYSNREPVSGATISHRPRLRVLGFPKRDSPLDVKVEGTDTWKTATVTYPYRDYADYLRRHDQNGGYYISSKEKIIAGGIPATRQEVKIEKSTMVPRRIFVCIYHLPDRDLAAEAEVAEPQAETLSNELEKTVRSLIVTGEAKRAESAPASPGSLTITTGTESRDTVKRAVKEWDDQRRAWRERALEEVQRTLPKGWSSRKTKHFLVLTHASARYTELILWQANEIRDWLDENFKNVGEGAVMRSILRICASSDEARAYSSGSGDSYVAGSGEVVCAERDGSLLDDFNTISGALLDQYLADRNPALAAALPVWLKVGLDQHVGGARISKKAGGLVFPLPVSSLRTCGKLLAEKRLMPADQIMRTEPQSVERGGGAEAYGDFLAESELLVRYFLLGPGKSGKTKDLVKRTMRAAVEQLESRDVEAWRKAAESRPATTPTTEAEEEAEFNRLRLEGQEFAKKHRAERLELLSELTGTVLKDWKPDDWSRLNKGFEGWIKAGLKP